LERAGVNVMAQFLELFGSLTISTMITWIIAISFITGIVWKTIPKVTEWYDKRKADKEVLANYRKDVEKIYETIKESNNATNGSFAEIKDSVNNICQAQIESLNDRIRQKCRYYISLGYIPEDEVEDFERMMKTYEKIGGNHGLQKKYSKTMELKVKIKEDEK